jgi:hypothetical protein
VKLGLAGLFFAIFLKGIFDRCDLTTGLFGACYGLCAWALGYQWNIMWLDTFALVPLVVLGMVYLLRDKKPALYTLTLFLSIFSNYYIGFFVCIFVLLLFFVYQICRWGGWKKFFLDLTRIAFFSALAIPSASGFTGRMILYPSRKAAGHTICFISTVGLNEADQNTNSAIVSIKGGSTLFVVRKLCLIKKNKTNAITIKCREYR